MMERLLACCLCFEITASHSEMFGLELDSVHTRQTGETFQQSRENPANIPSQRRKGEKKKPIFAFVRLTRSDNKTRVRPTWPLVSGAAQKPPGVGRCVFVFHLRQQLLFRPPATLVGWASGSRNHAAPPPPPPVRSNHRGY